MPTAVKIDEKTFESLKAERLLVLPRNDLVVMCIKRPGCEARPHGDFVQYVGVPAVKTYDVGVAPTRRNGQGNWDPPIVTKEVTTEALIIEGKVRRIIPFTLNGEGEIFSYTYGRNYAPKEPYGFFLGGEHVDAVLAG